MSGCVTVTGPPRAICSWNTGTTLPAAAEHVAEAHRHKALLRRGALRDHLHDLLGHALGRAHHATSG